MDKEFMQYVYTRIEKALINDKEYMKLQSDSVKAAECKDYDLYVEIQDGMQARAEETSFMQGFKDGAKMMLKILGIICY